MFTRQLIEEIKNKLYLLGKKDSLFNLVEDVGNDAYFSIVVDGENKRVSVQKFIDIVAEAISESKVGISLEFGDSILEGISLKTLTEALNAIYVVDEDSIIARSIYRTVILPPNMDEHNSCKLTQDMLLTPNTKYVIKYNYDVVENITIPANCILSVDGGKLFSSSGMKTITGVRNTFPDNGDYTLFETIFKKEVCVDLDSITLVNFSYASEGGDVDPSKIPPQSIDTTKLEDGSVTEPILANSAVTENKIANSAVTNNKIAANAVGENNIANNAVTEVKLKDGSVTPAKLAQSVVTDVIAPAIESGMTTKQDVLVDSGQNQNIKTINGSSILGQGDLEVLTEVEDGSITSAKLAPAVVEEIDGKADADDVNTALLLKSNAIPTADAIHKKADNSTVNSLSTTVSNISNNISSINQNVSTLSTNVNTTNSRLDDVSSDITGLNSSVSTINTDIRNINSDLTNNRYTKEEVNNLLSSTPETDVIIIDIPWSEYSGTIPDYLEANIPAAGRANKLYRVPNSDGTAYSEWAWDGSDWVMLADKDYGIDNEPTANSNNTVKSSGLLSYYGGFNFNGKDIVYAITDSKDRTLFAINKAGDVYLPGIGIDTITDILNRLSMIIDPTGKIVSYRRKDGTLVETGNVECETLSVSSLNLGAQAIDDVLNITAGCVAGDVLTWRDGHPQLLDPHLQLIGKKSDSLVNLVWTPKTTAPNRYDNKDTGNTWPANVSVTGVPYSATYEIDKRIGMDVSLETFMTAVNNPYSLFYTEGLSRDRGVNSSRATNPRPPQSIWWQGRIIDATTNPPTRDTYYHGINKYAGSYYGCVCAEFTDYCTGVPHSFLAAYAYKACDLGVNGRVAAQSAQAAKVGDLLYTSGHVAVIRDIHYSDSGVVDEVIVSEQASKSAYQTVYTAEGFNARLADDYTMYRPLSFEGNTSMWEFDADNYEYNNDICTFAGDKACFREGQLIVLNYNLSSSSSYTHIELYKDNTLKETYKLSDIDQNKLPIGQRNHALVLFEPDDPCYIYYDASHQHNYLPYGDYKARLKIGSTYSDFTYFKIVETNVSLSTANDLVPIYDNIPINPETGIAQSDIDPDTGEHTGVFYDVNYDAIRVTFSSGNAIPTAIDHNFYGRYRTSTGGTSYCTYRCVGRYVLTDEDKERGYAILHKDDWVPSYSEYYYDDHNLTNPTWIKVFFNTEYGRITNKELPVHFYNFQS